MRVKKHLTFLVTIILYYTITHAQELPNSLRHQPAVLSYAERLKNYSPTYLELFDPLVEAQLPSLILTVSNSKWLYVPSRGTVKLDANRSLKENLIALRLVERQTIITPNSSSDNAIPEAPPSNCFLNALLLLDRQKKTTPDAKFLIGMVNYELNSEQSLLQIGHAILFAVTNHGVYAFDADHINGYRLHSSSSTHIVDWIKEFTLMRATKLHPVIKPGDRVISCAVFHLADQTFVYAPIDPLVIPTQMKAQKYLKKLKAQYN